VLQFDNSFVHLSSLVGVSELVAGRRNGQASERLSGSPSNRQPEKILSEGAK